MKEIQKISTKNDLIIIEDEAQGVNAKYKIKYLGSRGSIECYSFHKIKNYNSREGGAILINKMEYTEVSRLSERKGTNANQLFSGDIDKYTWVDISFS